LQIAVLEKIDPRTPTWPPDLLAIMLFVEILRLIWLLLPRRRAGPHFILHDVGRHWDLLSFCEFVLHYWLVSSQGVQVRLLVDSFGNCCTYGVLWASCPSPHWVVKLLAIHCLDKLCLGAILYLDVFDLSWLRLLRICNSYRWLVRPGSDGLLNTWFKEYRSIKNGRIVLIFLGKWPVFLPLLWLLTEYIPLGLHAEVVSIRILGRSWIAFDGHHLVNFVKRIVLDLKFLH